MIYLLRKSILNDVSPNKSKKKIKKIKEYEFNYKKKFDENFNIINLFLSDEKKLKNKRNKRYKKYNNYQHKTETYDSDDNKKNIETDNNSIDKEKIKIINNGKRKNIKHRKRSKKFLFLYNEELINEEDEEKEKDEDE